MTIGTLISKGEIKISDTCKYISDMKENNTKNNYKIRVLITIEVEQWTFCYTVFITQFFQKTPHHHQNLLLQWRPSSLHMVQITYLCVSGFPWELRWAMRRFCVVPNSLLTPPLPPPPSVCVLSHSSLHSRSLGRHRVLSLTLRCFAVVLTPLHYLTLIRPSPVPPLPSFPFYPGRGDTVLKYLSWQIIKGDAT